MSTSQPDTPSNGELSGVTELLGLNRGRAPEKRMANVTSDLVGVVLPSSRSFPDEIVRHTSHTVGSIPLDDSAPGNEFERAGVDKLMIFAHAADKYRFGYRLIDKLNSGGMGETYRAWDKGLFIPVVVKMPKRELQRNKDLMTRFAREIAAMRAVPHQSIVPIVDSGEYEGCPFVVMRFLPGGSLAEYCRRSDSDTPTRNPPGMLHFWLQDIALAIDHIHSKGMLHRDVKPGNIFLDGFLKPYLGDFGIAKVVDDSGGLLKAQSLTATQMAIGTPEYMAPELFTPKAQLDGRVDQYALAVVVYEMLSGDRPFTGSTAHIIVEHSTLPAPPLAKKCEGLPRSACAAVHRALSKNPTERYRSCREFAAAVLADIQPLEREADTVRLLCPSCRNILKLPQRTAGKKGRCPRCQSPLDVAMDLGSLWLESEERGDGLAGTEKRVEQPIVADKKRTYSGKSISQHRRKWLRFFDLAVAVIIGLVFGLVQYAQHDVIKRGRVIQSALRVYLDDSRKHVVASNSRIEECEKQLDERQDEIKDLHSSLDKAQKNLSVFMDATAAALSNHKGNLWLDVLAALTDSQAEALAQHEGELHLDGLTTLSDAQAESLSKHKGGLFLGMTMLSDAQARALAKYQGDLHMGLITISDAQADSLAKHKGWLELNSLSTLTDRQAEAFSKHEGRMSLHGLTELSEKGAESIRNNSSVEVPEKFRHVAPRKEP